MAQSRRPVYGGIGEYYRHMLGVAVVRGFTLALARRLDQNGHRALVDPREHYGTTPNSVEKHHYTLLHPRV